MDDKIDTLVKEGRVIQPTAQDESGGAYSGLRPGL